MPTSDKNGSSESNEDGCPIPNTHNRLEQAHRLWHQALEQYDDPDGFRANLNATIEALRNVTFMLQSEKHAVPGFDAWYEPWQTRMKSDPIMKWLCGARTTVVHKSDLEIASKAHGEIHNNLTLANFISPLPPLMSTASMCRLVEENLPEPFASNRKDVVLTLERRWSVEDLPDHELLDALAHAYGVLSQITKEAHALSGRSFKTVAHEGNAYFEGDGRLPCMVTTKESRIVRVSLYDSRPLIHSVETQSTTRVEGERAADRYKLRGTNWNARSRDPFEVAESILPLAKTILIRDKYHSRIVFLLTPVGWTTLSIQSEDRAEKYTMIRIVAEEIKKRRAVALVDVGEVWIAPEEEVRKGRMPENVRTRKEALQITVATSDGKFRQYTTVFRRTIFRKIKLADTTTRTEAEVIPFYLAPIFEVWGKQVPGIDRQPGA